MKKIVAVLIVCTQVQIIPAQQTHRDTAIINELPAVVVMAYGFSKQTNSNAANSHILSEQIVLTRPEKVTEALTYLPGVYSVPDGIGGQTLNIRGFEQNRVNIYFNGIPLRSNTEGRISTDGLFFTNSDISIEKGTASLIYGSNSSGNVIRVDNRILNGENFGIKVNSFLGNNGKQSYNALVTGKLNSKFHYQTSANYYRRRSMKLSDDFVTSSIQPTKERLNSDQENTELLTTLTFVLNNRQHFSLTAMYNSSQFGYPSSITTPRFRRMDYWQNIIIGLRHTITIKDKFNVESNLYTTHLKDTLNEYKDKTYTSIRRFSYWNDLTYGVRNILSYQPSKSNKISCSFDYKFDIHEQMWFTNATTKANTLQSTIEYRGNLLKKILVNIGTSYNFSNPRYTNKNEAVARRKLSDCNYQVSFGYTPKNSKYKIHFGYSKMSIFPRMRDLYGDAIIGYTANPNLKSEQSNTFDLGLDSKLLSDKITFQFSIFSSQIKNLITQVKATDTTNWVINLQSAKYFGSEFMIKFSPKNGINTFASYTYLKARNTSTNRFSDYIAYRPDHQLKGFAVYTLNKYIGFDVAITYSSKRYYDNQNNWYSIPGYSIIDLSLFSKPVSNFTIWLKANNLLDKNYFMAFDQPQAGREYRIGLTFEFKHSR